MKNPPTAKIGRIIIAAVAANAPGFFTIFSGLEAAVATIFTEPANNGSSPIAMRIAPTFCSSSPASADDIKKGGMVTKRNSMFAFCIDADQTGLPAVKGMM